MKSKKFVALFFIFLMVASSIAFAFISSTRMAKQEEVKIPTQRIINYRLSDVQRHALLSNGYTLVEYEFPNACLDCASKKSSLENIAQTSNNQIFLQELMGYPEEKLTMTSLKGQKILENFTEDDINSICEILVQEPLWCISSKL